MLSVRLPENLEKRLVHLSKLSKIQNTNDRYLDTIEKKTNKFEESNSDFSI